MLMLCEILCVYDDCVCVYDVLGVVCDVLFDEICCVYC